MVTWVLFVIFGLVVGFGFGMYIGRLDDFSSKKRQAEMNSELKETKQEFDHYKQHVNEHFQETAKLIDDLTKSYYAVHEHLTKGSKTFYNGPLQLGGTAPVKKKLLQESQAKPSDPVLKTAVLEQNEGSKKEEKLASNPIIEEEKKDKKAKPTVH